VDIVGSKAYR
jgi:hypothetical protein